MAHVKSAAEQPISVTMSSGVDALCPVPGCPAVPCHHAIELQRLL